MVRNIKPSKHVKDIENIEKRISFLCQYSEKIKESAMKTNNKELYKLISNNYEVSKNLSNQLFFMTKDKGYEINYNYFFYEERKALINFYALDEDFEKSLQVIEEMEILLENLIKKINEIDPEKAIVGYQNMLIEYYSFKESDLALKFRYKAENYAKNKNLATALAYLDVAIEKTERFMEKLKEDVMNEKITPIHLQIEEGNLNCLKGRRADFLSIILQQDKSKLNLKDSLEECLKAINYLTEGIKKNPNHNDTKRVREFLIGRLKLILIEDMNYESWKEFYQIFEKDYNLITQMKELDSKLFNEIINSKEKREINIYNAGGVFNNTGNIGDDNTIIGKDNEK